MRIFDVLYHTAWTAAALGLMPACLLSGERGRLRRLSWTPPPRGLQRRGLWVHALSVGEVLSAVPLMDTLRGAFPGRALIFSASTARGLATAQREIGGRADAVLEMPVDFWLPVRRMVKYVDPALFVLVETDIWPGILGFLKDRGVPSVLVNGRVSPRTYRAYRRGAPLVRRMFASLDLCLMQSERDCRRLVAARVVQPERCVAVGNIKFDRRWRAMDAGERTLWLDRLGFSAGDEIWVAGSTHPGEEKVILDIFSALKAFRPRLRLLVAPRDVGRTAEVREAARKRGLEVRLRTSGNRPTTGGCEVVILDTIGELERVYGLAALAFVGGSLVPVGGHNLLEPASFGCPVLFGRHTHNFADMAAQLLEAGGGLCAADAPALQGAVEALLVDKERCRRMGTRARMFVQANGGALERVTGHLQRCLEQRSFG